jgi:hypothetical protein
MIIIQLKSRVNRDLVKFEFLIMNQGKKISKYLVIFLIVNYLLYPSRSNFNNIPLTLVKSLRAKNKMTITM